MRAHLNAIIAKKAISIVRGLLSNYKGTTEDLWKEHEPHIMDIITNSIEYKNALENVPNIKIKSYYPKWLVSKLKTDGKTGKAEKNWDTKTVLDFWDESTPMQQQLMSILYNGNTSNSLNIKNIFLKKGFKWTGNYTLAGTKGTLHSRAVKKKYPYIIKENNINGVWNFSLTDEFKENIQKLITNKKIVLK